MDECLQDYRNCALDMEKRSWMKRAEHRLRRVMQDIQESRNAADP